MPVMRLPFQLAIQDATFGQMYWADSAEHISAVLTGKTVEDVFSLMPPAHFKFTVDVTATTAR